MATLESDLSLIRDPHAKEHAAYPAFVVAMRGRCYGSEPLNSAWHWFKYGWESDVADNDAFAALDKKMEAPCAPRPASTPEGK